MVDRTLWYLVVRVTIVKVEFIVNLLILSNSHCSHNFYTRTMGQIPFIRVCRHIMVVLGLISEGSICGKFESEVQD
jgi:hypothetical protein